jgi:hypothetical protein
MKRIFWILAVTLTSLGVWALAQTSNQTTSIGTLRSTQGISIEGTVASVFGNKFVLEDASGQVLVETVPGWFQQLEFTPGERLTVIGEMDYDEFEAFRIIRANGETLELRNVQGPPPWAGPNRDIARGEGRGPPWSNERN